MRHRQSARAHGGYLAAGEDKVACGYLLVHALVQEALIHALVVAADQDKMVILCLQFTATCWVSTRPQGDI